MALTKEVTIVGVSKQMDGLWNITLNLKYLDGTEELVNQNFSVQYRSGQDVEAKAKVLRKQMQKAIDDYKSEQQIKNSSQLATAVTWLQNNLVV